MAFKTATVTSGDVPSTQTNFPSFFNPSRAGATTLADVQSGRVYADSGKVVEWAREAVGVEECHTKAPSLTSTTSIFYDYDGVRADYAATDTYGRNAVWGDYRAVHHLNDVNDSTSNAYTLTNNNSVTFTSGKLGNAADLGSSNTNKFLSIANTLGITNGNITATLWVKLSTDISTSGHYGFLDKASGAPTHVQYRIQYFTPSSVRTIAATRLRQNVVENNANHAITLGTSDWYKFDLVYSTSDTTVRNYINGVQQATVSSSGNGSGAGANQYYLGALRSGAATVVHTSGVLDEARITTSVRSADWITTEYNNQSDEAGFWGTWTDVGGGFTPTPMMHHVLMTGGLM